MGNIYITMVDRPDAGEAREFHRSKIIVHNGWMYYLAEFSDIQVFERWAQYCGIEMTLEEEKEAKNPACGQYKHYSTELNAVEYEGFWSREQVPAEAKPIKLHSNGSIVTGYILNDGSNLHIFRPNPNAKEVYKPLSLKKHIAYKKSHGGL